MKKEILYKVLGVDVRMRSRHRTRRDGSRKLIPDWEYQKPTVVHVWLENESLLENLIERRSRPYEDYRPFVQKELKDAGIDATIRWSQKAGCSCGCSPGFVIKVKDDNGPLRDEDRSAIDTIHIRVTPKQ